eukprot:sb/3462733/
MKITVLRRKADDFLSTLQANLQTGGNTRRRKGAGGVRQVQQREPPAVVKTRTPPTVNQAKNKNVRAQNSTLPKKQNANKPKVVNEQPKVVNERPKAVKPPPQDVAESPPEEISILEPPPPPAKEPTIPTLNLARVPERVSPPAVSRSYDASPTGKNNFYFKNQSNIFSWATEPVAATPVARSNNFQREEVQANTAKELQRKQWIQELEKQIDTKKSGSVAMQQPVTSPMSALPSPANSNCLMGANSLMDPLEAERRQDARRRARENQELIRMQVEEKERKKKEEEARLKREEEAEMRKIEEEARRMAEEVKREQEKSKEKERRQLAQIMEMRNKIEEATKQAEAEKRGRRSGSSPTKTPAPTREVRRTPAPVQRSPAQQRSTSPPPQQQYQSPVQQSPSQHQPPFQQSSPQQQYQPPSQQQYQPPPTQQQQYHQQQPTTQQYHQPPQTSSTMYHQPPQTSSTMYHQQPPMYAPPVVQQSTIGTQTVCEVSCQTSTTGEREGTANSRLPSDTKLIEIPDRELSVIQKKKKASTAVGTTRKKKEQPPPGRVAAAADKRRKPPAVQYDKNGRRIKTEKEEVVSTPGVKSVPEVESPACRSIADILDDPSRCEENSSGLKMNENQIQMRYTSPQNEDRTIPSAITERQNDILGQLERLRMGLRNRRMHIPADGAA